MNDDMSSGVVLVNNSCIYEFVDFEFPLLKGWVSHSGSKIRQKFTIKNLFISLTLSMF